MANTAPLLRLRARGPLGWTASLSSVSHFAPFGRAMLRGVLPTRLEMLRVPSAKRSPGSMPVIST